MNQTPQPGKENSRTVLEEKFTNIISPFQRFLRDQATASIILIVCTLFALFLANSELAADYQALLASHAGIFFESWRLEKSILHWVNDGLMSIFFFILGLEIKREILAGDLQTRERALPVMAAALGGMLFPALIYYFLNFGSTTSHGWGIPMATDTAFAVGILALLGKHIPRSLLAFLAALAIIDDIGAILVIAIFYTETISTPHLLVASLLLGLLIFFNLLGIRRPTIYIIIGGIIWYAMLKSGVHATIAGILVAFTVPARARKGKRWFLQRANQLIRQLEDFEYYEKHSKPILAEREKHAVLERVEDTAKQSTTPLQRWEHGLEHPVALFVLPLFALANAGIELGQFSAGSLFTEPVTLGIICGLVIGKSLGISLFGWLTIRLGWGNLPPGMNRQHLVGVAFISGIGFTMSIFISSLSFAGDPPTLIAAKSAILAASLLAGIIGYSWLRFLTTQQTQA
jgi:NhaA family Na+:H+ antiporter